ncbi:MAG TPA: serine/threonine-protein kinase, partial [Rhodothermales bacterium]|nr:serine/threonine-protein kinase [Rhodothermales bacterium]
GGMGVVYKAEDQALSRLVAIKMIDPTLARDDGFMRRFRSEARALARVDSPYIVRVHALRKTERGLFIVMEYVDGGTLHDLPAPYPWQRALPLATQMLVALEHAHSVGIVHRDIKPRNIMISRSGAVKVTDFGLAKISQESGRTTVTQGIAGTLYYMSPEQVKGLATLDHRSDLYSLGMTLYELIAGRLPFDKEAGEFTTMRRIVEESLPPPSQYRKDIPPALDTVIMRALAKDPAVRYQSAEEMRQDLEKFSVASNIAQADDGKTLPFTTSPFEKHRALTGRRLAVGVIVVLLVIGAAVGGYAYFTRPAVPPVRDLAKLSVTSVPSGALLFLDGEAVGSAPLREFSLNKDSVSIRLVKEGFVPLDTLVRVTRGAVLPLTLRLDSAKSEGFARAPQEVRRVVETEPDAASQPAVRPAYAHVTMQSDLPSGIVKVQGKVVQPGNAVSVPAGTPIWVQCGDGKLIEAKQVVLGAGEGQTLTCHFKRSVYVQTRADDGTTPWAPIQINGSSTGDYTPFTYELPAGTYNIGVQIERGGYEPVQDEAVAIKPTFQDELPVITVVIALRKTGQYGP